MSASLLERKLPANRPAVSEPLPDVSKIRKFQQEWAATSLSQRLQLVCKLRHEIAEHGMALASETAAVLNRPLAEKLTSEVLPLADACRWLEKSARSVLADKKYGRSGRPFWMHGVEFEVQRQPHGLVLVIGPGNYPLFLPAVHALQALVAGNAVLLKPAPGCRTVALAFHRLVVSAGFPATLLAILPEEIAPTHQMIARGVNKVIFTGSSRNGRELLALLSRTNTPSVMELSGEDPMIVLPGADLEMVARAVQFGLNLNGGNTCMAPRQMFLAEAIAEECLRRLSARNVPRLPVTRFVDVNDVVQAINQADMALGASIFSGDVTLAKSVAAQLQTGFVLINDLIAPTADPRMPFCGVRASGFGTTRGAEGLLEMTFPHVVGERRGSLRPHFDPPEAGDETLFAAYLQAVHGKERFAGMKNLLSALSAKIAAKRQLS